MSYLKKYVINLKRREDRLKKFMDICPYKDVVPFYGFDGKFIETNEKGMEYFEIFKKFPHKLLVGEIGCYISHLLLWQSLVESNSDMIMIFEDDAIFNENFLSYMAKIEKELPNIINKGILYIGGCFIPNYEIKHTGMYITDNIYEHDYSKPSFVYTDFERTTHAYIITRQCAQKLLYVFSRGIIIHYPVDNWIGRVCQRLNIDVFSTNPLLCHSPVNSESDIRDEPHINKKNV
jgi:GR25 family glycosyltransferase involved in LPS biosynthesis